MGAVQNVVDRLRQAFVLDKERGGELLAKGSTSPSYPDSGYDLLQAYGYDALSDYLRLEHDLLSRYVDYEEMDDYPEVACLAGESAVFTLEGGWQRIEALPGQDFHVLSYDRVRRSLVPAKARVAQRTGKAGHNKSMVRVVLDDGSAIRCTADHLFLTKEGAWVEAGKLGTGQRLMPGAARLRALNGADGLCYWQVHQPHADSQVRAADGRRWTWVHRLVGEELLRVAPGAGDILHHRDHNPLNNAPSNLSVEGFASHAQEHIAKLDNRAYFPEWTPERREARAKRMRGNSFSKGCKRSEAHKGAIAKAARRPKSTEHRHRIGKAQPNRIDIPRERVEAAIQGAPTLAGAARELGVSWSWVKRKAVQWDLQADSANHRVLRVEVLEERPDVYDIEVPGYRNFVCNGVVVHNSAVDIYADDASQPDTSLGRTVWVTSKDRTLQGVLDDLFHKRLRLDEEIWEITRSLVKYGNDYEEMLVTNDGVVGLNFLPAPTVRRVEGPRGELYGFVQDFKGRFGYSPQEFQKILAQRTDAIRNMAQPGTAKQPGNMLQRVSAMEPWEVSHFRLRGKHRRSIYGYSVLEPVRWIWKRLMLLEDAAMIYRLQRAPERFAFYVDVGDLPPAEALAFVNKIRQQHKKKRFVNPSTGKLDLKFEPLSQDDDFYVPVRKGVEGTRIEVLGGPSWQHMDDVEYFQKKMFSGLKVPKAYLAQDESAARAVLSSEDVRFARSVLRVQREVKNGLRKIARTHLAALNIDPYAVEYDIHMTVPSAIFELAQLEVRNARADLASRMKEHVSLRWVLTNVYQLADEDIETVLKERSDDIKREGAATAEAEKMSLRANAEVERENAAQAGGGGGGGAAPRFAHAGTPKGMKLLEAKLATLPDRIRRSISESEMSRGSREGEKRANDKLDRLLRSNDQQVRRIREVGALLRDVADATRR